MTFGQPTDLPTILSAIATQAATAGTWIRPAYSFVGFGEDEFDSGGPADTFIAVVPPMPGAMAPMVAGGLDGMEGIITVCLFDRLSTDEDYRQTNRMGSSSLGILNKWQSLKKVLQLFQPTRSGVCILQEPMRLVDFGARKVKKTGWARLDSRWNVKWVDYLS